MLRVHALGEQRVSVQGASSTPPAASARALEILIYLALHAGRAQPRVQLACLLWPDSSESQARTNLRRELHHLRQLPGMETALQAEGAALSWNDDGGCFVDVRHFEVERAQALEYDAAGNSPALLEHACAAIDAYKGDLLPGLYEEWVLEERETLRRHCIELCDLASAAARNLGDSSTAIGAMRRRIQLEPLEEAGYQALMSLQAESGDTAAAVRTYHRCASVLEQELGIDPGTRTRALAQRLLGTAPDRAVKGASPTAPPAASTAAAAAGATLGAPTAFRATRGGRATPGGKPGVPTTGVTRGGKPKALRTGATESGRPAEGEGPTTTASGAAGPSPSMAAAPGPPAVDWAGPRPRDIPLIGREREEALLAALWQRAASGQPRMVVVSGDAGVGKSRLVAALATTVRAQRAVTAGSRCYAGSGRIALAPVAGWLRSPDFRAVAETMDATWGGEVSRLLPTTANAGTAGYAGSGATGVTAGNGATAGPAGTAGNGATAGNAGPEGIGPAASVSAANALIDAWQRHQFFEGLAQAVLASGRPTLLILDDLQWCDEETMNWLGFLLDYAPEAPLLVAATARSGELEDNAGIVALLRALRSAGWVIDVELTPLDSLNTAELAEAVSGRAVQTQEGALLHAATGGYPLYIVEAARGRDGDGLASALTGATDVGAVLRRRMEQSSPVAREVAGLAAGVGREFSLDLLAQSGGMTEQALVRAVDELWRHRIIREQPGGYDFAHDLLRQTAYESVSPPQRWLLHRRLAQALEVLHSGSTDAVAAQLAEQYRKAGSPARALHYFARAGDVSTRIFANAQALKDYQRCLDFIVQLPQGTETDDLELLVLQKMPAPLTALRGYASVQLRRTVERMVELADRLGRPHIRLAGLIGLFAATFVQGETALAHRIGARALELSKAFPDLAGQAHFAYAGAATSLGHAGEAIHHFDLACSLSPDGYSYILGTRVEVHARAWSAHAYWLAGDDDGAQRLAADALDRARQLGIPTVRRLPSPMLRFCIKSVPAVRRQGPASGRAWLRSRSRPPPGSCGSSAAGTISRITVSGDSFWRAG
ncbi:AAA family ATPase [Paenarthrobacter sp. Z7-10]|uniref:AAA family ATPase n=1 Tax=Paenarthrobacter sp. Z7-10 TaxID=2787635 RepID=UPI0022A985E0|nr:AAA family ATPase [Paenarthrobacter sp. Z7-10]MCZ2404992.1 AAA family ATPase [Paenarthrobacter sp. Z7-10]